MRVSRGAKNQLDNIRCYGSQERRIALGKAISGVQEHNQQLLSDWDKKTKDRIDAVLQDFAWKD